MPSRYLEHDHCHPQDVEAVSVDILNALIADVDSVQHRSHARAAGGHVYVGAAGIALLNLRLAELNIPELPRSYLLHNADSQLAAAFSLARFSSSSFSLSPAKCSFIETDAGVATLVLYRAMQMSRASIPGHSSNPPSFTENWRQCAAVFHKVVRQAVPSADEHKASSSPVFGDDRDCEVLYGRAGLLYALLFLRSALTSQRTTWDSDEIVSTITDLVSDSNIRHLVDSIIMRGKTGSSLYRSECPNTNIPALMWSWHGKRYLGAAHGVAGILHVLLLCPITTITLHIPSILNTVEWLLDLQDPDGNWPSSAPSRPSHHNQVNELVHWCHGAPGTVVLLSTVLRRLPTSTETDISDPNALNPVFREKINSCISRGASLVYSRGFLRKGVGLCHGVAGSIFSLLAAADVQPDNAAQLLQQAVHLAHLATHYRSLTKHGMMSIPDRPWSLYEGVAGMCCAWGEVLKRIKRSETVACCGMPGFDDVSSDDCDHI